MGLLPSSLKLILQFHKHLSFEGPVLSIGNQDIWANYEQLKTIFEEMGVRYCEPKEIARHTSYTFSSNEAINQLTDDFVHAKVFFEMLGLPDYCDIDKFVSDAPMHQHDMNMMIPQLFHDRFSLILDGGTIEHIFDIRQVMANILLALKVGGHVVHISSYSVDHGFYGISPTFFYDFYKANGFSDFSCFAMQVDFSDILSTYKNPQSIFEYQYGMPMKPYIESGKELLIFFVAKREKRYSNLMIPTQGIYGELREGNVQSTGDRDEVFVEKDNLSFLQKKANAIFNRFIGKTCPANNILRKWEI